MVRWGAEKEKGKGREREKQRAVPKFIFREWVEVVWNAFVERSDVANREERD